MSSTAWARKDNGAIVAESPTKNYESGEHEIYVDGEFVPVRMVSVAEHRSTVSNGSTNGHKNNPGRCLVSSGVDLLAKEFPEHKFAVPGILPEGLIFAAGAPKLGKSWWGLGLSIAVAAGGMALGQIPVEQGEVLFLGLEDTERRLQSRVRTILRDDPCPTGFYYGTEWDRLTEGGEEALSEWLDQHPDCRLVILDVFAKLRPQVSERGDRYLADYQAAQPLKALADRHKLALLAFHHTRKADSDDFVESISGTQGLAGAADAILVMKRSRGQADATLQVTGRDVEERDFALRFAPDLCTWELLGDAAEWAISEERRKIRELLGDSSEPLGPKAISERLGLKYDSVRVILGKMVGEGQVRKVGRGLYVVHNIHNEHEDPLSKSPSVNDVNEVNSRERGLLKEPRPFPDFTPLAASKPCCVCGQPALMRDPAGNPRHPACRLEDS